MSVINFSNLNPEIREAQTYSDPESGCTVYNDRQAFESCKQAYYLKKQTERQGQTQQSQINQTDNDDTSDVSTSDTESQLIESKFQLINTQLQDIQEEVSTLKAENTRTKEYFNDGLYICIGVITTIVLIISANYILRKWKKIR